MSEISRFVSKRKNSITENRIKVIIWYIAECYTLLLNSKTSYSEKKVKTSTTIAFEDYLRFRLIEDYLVKNKKLLKNKMSCLEKINFTAETQKEYIDTMDGKQKPDKIDVFINKLGVNRIWNENDENIYFAIECKRIKQLSDTSRYIKDIEKFSNRNYLSLRLPFEGQLAFVEAKDITHNDISTNINKKLESIAYIITETPLFEYPLHEKVSGIYKSAHKKNATKEIFSIYHLILDYSKIVTD